MALILLVIASTFSFAARKGEPEPDLSWSKPNAEPIHVGLVADDALLYQEIQRQVGNGAIGTREGAASIELVLGRTSQAARAAAALPLLRAGVAYGNASLMEVACNAADQVTYPPLEAHNRLGTVRAACGALHAEVDGRDACSRQEELALHGYERLLAQDVPGGRRLVNEALQNRVSCPGAPRIAATPVRDFDGLGFVLVSVAQLLDLPAEVSLTGETTMPNVVTEIYEAYESSRTVLLASQPAPAEEHRRSGFFARLFSRETR